eukprot:7895919-Pyramimonas_sp.AAC.1
MLAHPTASSLCRRMPSEADRTFKSTPRLFRMEKFHSPRDDPTIYDSMVLNRREGLGAWAQRWAD